MKIIGPCIGDVKHNGIKFWIGIIAETADPIRETNTIEIRDSSTNGIIDSISFKEEPLSNHQYKLYCKGWYAETNKLSANTTYKYTLKIKFQQHKLYQYESEFSSAPDPNSASDYKILVCSCLNAKGKYSDNKQKVWKVINEKLKGHQSISLILGDTNYSNSECRGKKWEYTEYQYAISDFQKHVSSFPTYTIYDDHDFAGNNTYGARFDLASKGPNEYSKREDIARYFNRLWPNPKNESRKSKEGCFYLVTYGNIEIYMLDTIYYRENLSKTKKKLALLGSNEIIVGSDPSINLVNGNIQWEWLKEKICKHPNKLKIICSGSTFGSLKKNYLEEVNALFGLLEEYPNVLLLSGDIHKLANRKHKFNNRIYNELVSSGLGRSKKPNEVKEILGGFLLLDVSETKKEVSWKFYQFPEKNAEYLKMINQLPSTLKLKDV